MPHRFADDAIDLATQLYNQLFLRKPKSNAQAVGRHFDLTDTEIKYLETRPLVVVTDHIGLDIQFSSIPTRTYSSKLLGFPDGKFDNFRSIIRTDQPIVIYPLYEMISIGRRPILGFVVQQGTCQHFVPFINAVISGLALFLPSHSVPYAIRTATSIRSAIQHAATGVDTLLIDHPISPSVLNSFYTNLGKHTIDGERRPDARLVTDDSVSDLMGPYIDGSQRVPTKFMSVGNYDWSTTQRVFRIPIGSLAPVQSDYLDPAVKLGNELIRSLEYWAKYEQDFGSDDVLKSIKELIVSTRHGESPTNQIPRNIFSGPHEYCVGVGCSEFKFNSDLVKSLWLRTSEFLSDFDKNLNIFASLTLLDNQFVRCRTFGNVIECEYHTANTINPIIANMRNGVHTAFPRQPIRHILTDDPHLPRISDQEYHLERDRMPFLAFSGPFPQYPPIAWLLAVAGAPDPLVLSTEDSRSKWLKPWTENPYLLRYYQNDREGGSTAICRNLSRAVQKCLQDFEKCKSDGSFMTFYLTDQELQNIEQAAQVSKWSLYKNIGPLAGQTKAWLAEQCRKIIQQHWTTSSARLIFPTLDKSTIDFICSETPLKVPE